MAALLLLAGCATGPKPATETAALPAEPPATSPAPPASANPVAENTATVPAAGLVKPARPEDILGLAADALEKLLGRPELVRRDAPAEVWQYRSASCVVDVYLYPENTSYRVAFIEARDSSAASMAADRCFDSLAKPSI